MQNTTINRLGARAARADRDLGETIGTCEYCGATDHHLVDGICPACRPKCAAFKAAIAAKILCNIDAFTRDACAPNDRSPMLPDEQLEFWGEYFARERLHAEGVLFEAFLRHPHEIAQALVLRRLDRPARRHVRAISRPLFDADLVFLRRQAD